MRTLETPALVQPAVVAGGANSETKTPKLPADTANESPKNQPEQTKQPGTDLPSALDDVVRGTLDLVQPIIDCEVDIRELTRTRVDLRRQLEELEDELVSLDERKQRIIKTLPADLLAIHGISDEDLPPPEEHPGEDTAKESDPIAEAPEPDWTELPTKSICDGVPRLGEKKIILLCDEFPTLGELNAAREKAASSKQHFSTALPKGIGKETADELANRLMTAETGGSSQSAEEQAKQTREELSQPEDETPTKSKFAKWVSVTVKSLRAAAGANSPGVLDCQHDSDTWDEGNEAFRNGVSFDSCPSGYTDEYASDWLRGWVAGEMVDAAEVQKSEDTTDQEAETIGEAEQLDEPQATEEASEPTAAPAEKSERNDEIEVSRESNRVPKRDELESIAERIKESGETSCKSAKVQWDKGYEAGIDEQPLEACPEMFLYMTEDWIRGWIEGVQLGADL
ncbi:Rmf/CrpP family protein [Roseiconus lacunae]|uniref:Rmf/CrpP family protein n=1 Tax=Roseiconus lacunae TaxID=2605694 RepID=UPI001E5BDEDA|nr:Rmf/CrpP family protein [Roseiconus lacunae]MCD0459151.1 hypothetical protein [Roseiconus lacunae]